ncbi:MAG TPA: hypothetical protein VMC48_06265, partial [Methanobacterium sp.]|nr:hypothetical protein [Methanobacterium sp.]
IIILFLSFIDNYMVALVIRAVDWGNIQRSPTFQGIFNYYFSDYHILQRPVVFESAGTHVDEIIRNLTPITKKLDIIKAGIKYDVIRGENKYLGEKFLGKWLERDDTQIPDKEKLEITRLYSKIKTDVHLHQMHYRNEALLEAGIPEQYLPGMRVPFRHDENLKLILPLEENIVRDVERYYKTIKDKQPVTEIYGNLVEIKPLKDELDGGFETARKQVEYFLNTHEHAMEEIIKILSTK